MNGVKQMMADVGRRWGLGFLVAGAIALSAGCGGRTVIIEGAAAANSEFLILNQSEFTICYVHFSPTTDPNWGHDRLGPSEVINPGHERGWAVPADTYDFQLQDCNHRVLMERRGEPIGSGQRRTVTFRVPE